MPSKLYEKIKEIVIDIRQAVLGIDVRDSIANSIEAMNEKTEDLSYRQDCLGNTFEKIILQDGHTDIEVIAARTCSDGTVYETLPKRMDAIELMVKKIVKDLDAGVYDEISTEQEEPTSEKVKLWIPCTDDDKKEDDTPVTPPNPDEGELDPKPKPDEGDVVTVTGETKKAIYSVYWPDEPGQGGPTDCMGNKLIGYPDELTCAAPSSVPLGSKVLVKDTGTELDGKIFTVTDRGNAIMIKSDGTYIFDLCMKDETEANKFGMTYGNAVIGNIVTTTSKIATVKSSGLKVRSGPGTTYTQIAYVYKGYRFMILEEYTNSSWIKVDYNGKVAYVNGEYTNITTVTGKDDAQTGEDDNKDYVIDKNNPVLGIDVSHHNGDINWTKVKNAGVKFAIIRIGYGSRQSSGGVLDKQFVNNVKGAKAAGINIGVYFFSYASSLTKLKAEANWVIKKLNEYAGGTFSYPIYFDQEYDSLKNQGTYPNYKSKNPGKTVLTNYMTTFCTMLSEAGYYPGIYGNPDWFNNYINFSDIKGYPIWIAHYNVKKPSWTKSDYGIWQYGYDTISGISNKADADRGYVDYPALIKALHKNGF